MMIFNRTQADVDEAIALRESKVQKFQALTESEIETLERGMITINTLNRIENKQAELKDLFNAMGYWNTPIVNKAWDYDQIFYSKEFDRLVNNTKVLKDAFFVYSDTPAVPQASYYFQNINDLEKILNDLDVMINDVKSHFRQCGTFQSGEDD